MEDRSERFPFLNLKHVHNKIFGLTEECLDVALVAHIQLPLVRKEESEFGGVFTPREELVVFWHRSKGC